MLEKFQPGDHFEEYSPLSSELVARGVVLKVTGLREYQLLSVEYEDCPVALGMTRRTNVVLSLWCKKLVCASYEDFA
ncbi:MAG: hypothetical protein U0350_51795 [Caldilineaceae bacterium]